MGSFALHFLDVIDKVSDFWFLYPTTIHSEKSDITQPCAQRTMGHKGCFFLHENLYLDKYAF